MPLGIDLFCGLGGWTEGLLSEGYDVVGFDNERHVYGDQRYPAQLVLQDVLTLHGSQFRNAALIVASPPCQAYSYRAMPWKRAKALPPPSNELFDACFRIQREACEAAGHHIPLVVENVKGAQPWVGRAAWHYGSFYLWGDVPALMPSAKVLKVAGFNFHQQEKTGKPGGSFQSAAVKGVKLPGNDTFKANGLPCNKFTDPRYGSGVKQHGSGAAWFDKALDERRRNAMAETKAAPDGGQGYGGSFGWDATPLRRGNSHSSARKAASAQIAKIPFELARWIAYCYR